LDGWEGVGKFWPAGGESRRRRHGRTRPDLAGVGRENAGAPFNKTRAWGAREKGRELTDGKIKDEVGLERSGDERWRAAVLCSSSAVFRERWRPVEVEGKNIGASAPRCEGRHMVVDKL
jgi:hypothetical protein